MIVTIDGQEYNEVSYPGGQVVRTVKGSPENVRVIPSSVFWRRFSETEREKIVYNADSTALTIAQRKKLKRFLYELRLDAEVNLDDAGIQTIVNGMETIGTILDGAGRAAEILA